MCQAHSTYFKCTNALILITASYCYYYSPHFEHGETEHKRLNHLRDIRKPVKRMISICIQLV